MTKEIKQRITAMISQADYLMDTYDDCEAWDETLCDVVEALNCRVERLVTK